MTTYVVTASNWNSAAFWSGINAANGDTLDFSGLTTGYSVTLDSAGSILIDNGTTTFLVGNPGNGQSNANIASGQISNFSRINAPANGNGNTLTTDDGAQVITASSGDDSISTNGGGDTIYGLEGDDTIAGGTGDDRIDGGDDADSFIVANDFGNDTIRGGEGGDDDDTLDASALTGALTVTYSGDEAATITDGTATISVSEVENLILGNQADSVDGSAVTGGFNIDAGAGDDTVIDGAGNDTIDGGSGWDSVTLSEGGDDLLTDVEEVILNGDFGNDTLTIADGTDGYIGFYTDAGITLDFVDGTNATATQGANNAFLNGYFAFADSSHDDSFDASLAGAGISYYGWAGDDTVTGSSFSDSLFNFSSGSFVVDAGAGDDYVSGGNGANDIVGGSGNDSLSGGTGTDTLSGGSGADTIDGGRGDDTLAGGTGDDLLSGENDADTFVVEDNFGTDTIVGGEGVTYTSDTDRIDFSALTTGVNVTFSATEAGTATSDGNTLTFSQIEEIMLTDFDDSVDNSALSSAVSLDGGDGADTLIGGSGADTLAGGDGSDYIDGGAGDDLLTTGLGNDTLVGGAGNDTLMNSDGDDSLDGGAGDDSIVATGGEDTLRGGSGADTMEGGDDADTFIIEDGFGNDSITGGEGTTDPGDEDFDTIDLSALTGPVTVTYIGDEAGTITDGTDTITFTEIERLILTDQGDDVDLNERTAHIVAGDGNDTIEDITDGIVDAGAGDDMLDADHGAGTASIIGGTGNDTISWDSDGIEGVSVTLTSTDAGTYNWATAGDGSFEGLESYDLSALDDYFDGAAATDGFEIEGDRGNDTIIGGSGDDRLIGGSSDDSITGGNGDDQIFGDSGDDTIIGGGGDDRLDGGSGEDQITGGSGNDTFLYSVGDGSDTITDFNQGNTGTLADGDSTNNDFIDLSGYYDHISELHADQADDGILNQSNTIDTRGQSVDYSDNSEFGTGEGITFSGASADGGSFTEENTGVVCFAAGTMIDTPNGPSAVETLVPGDLVNTRAGGAQALLWVGRSDLTLMAGTCDPHHTPVRFKPAHGSEARAVLVSPQHCILMRLQNGKELFARARHLAEETRCASFACGRAKVSYVHLCFSKHSIVISQGIPSESFYPGAWARRMISAANHASLLDRVPGLMVSGAAESYGPRAAPVLSRADVRALTKANALTVAPAYISAERYDLII